MMRLETAQVAARWLKAQGATALTTDSRRITESSNGNAIAFIAWPGAAVDGRQFVVSALQKGAVAALVEYSSLEAATSILPPAESPQANQVAACSDLKMLSGDIAALFYGEPSQHLDIVAFTGTNGKTSSSWWLAQAMDGAVVGTLGIGRVGSGNRSSGIVSNGLTTPDPVLLQAQLKALLDEGCKLIALEASSIGLAEGRLNGTQIHTAVFTNFTQDHLDYHGSMEAYWQAKVALFEWQGLKAAVVNIDDPQGLALLDRLASKAQTEVLDIWTVAIDKPARLQALNVRTTATGLTFNVVETNAVHDANMAKEASTASHSQSLQTSLVGRYNVSNLLGVIAAMRSLGMPLAACILACGHISPVPGRLEVVTAMRTVSAANDTAALAAPLVVVDYAHTPDAMEKALVAMREVAEARGGKLWCVFGCGGDRDASKRPVMGATARAHADYVVVTSDNPRSEAPAAIISQILLGLEEDISVQVQADRALAIDETIAQAAAHDVVVIAGKGHEAYQEIAGVKHPFSDQAHAQSALSMWRAAS